MRSDWILDVLTDLRAFALSNDLPVLAEQLDDTAIVALNELTSAKEKAAYGTHGDTAGAGAHSRGAGKSRFT
jgi:flagellar biosynthesis/type III secretory pathway chaperone